MERYRGLTEALLKHSGMAGFCYTQLTDVEQEVNGLYTYDRRPKFDPAVIRSITSQKAAIEEQEESSKQNSGIMLDGEGKPAIICNIPAWRRTHTPSNCYRRGGIEVEEQESKPRMTAAIFFALSTDEIPDKSFVLGFLAVIVLGALLLMLPAATVDRTFLGPVDALFTATSAVCVTGWSWSIPALPFPCMGRSSFCF